ncbi:acetylornithine deacetylase [Legionella busanensis]|uniref:Acetylornithine deacetylase n=1 Tax=Legionella busanensis TaxID=190655 RepID=A0A378JMN3_9GAMM|nr:acetylornithine deacetylase [Legionella busanensis]STX51290.1 acetylornithine deacetylase [Legionella busanensis]
MTIVDWLTTLIAFDTTSSKSNLELINNIADWLSNYNIKSRLTFNDDRKKANLFATLPAANGNTAGGIILSGHTDIVPVTDQAWTNDPFKAVILDDKLFGRGACDMKGFIAVALSLLPKFQQLKLSYPIHFAFSYDEEVGCLGAPLLIKDLQSLNCSPKACIVGEPTNMYPIIAHKGINVFRCQIRGNPAHSSLTPKGCNAIEYAAQLILFLKNLASQFKEQQLDKDFDVPFTTLTTNVIQGGTAHNIIPEFCEFVFEFRNLPDHAALNIKEQINAYITDHLLPKMQQEYPLAQIDLSEVASVTSFAADPNAKFIKLCQSISGEQDLKKVAYATEAGLFQEAAIPTIVCGPGSIEQAHRSDEFVTLQQLEKCRHFLLSLIAESNKSFFNSLKD